MVGKVAKIPMNHRILRCDKTDIDFSGDPAINLSDTVFEFLDDEGDRSSSSPYSICDNVRDEDDENEEKEFVQDTDFWENQYNLLHATLCRTTSAESRIRSITKETLKEAKQAGNMCACQKPVDGGCRSCRMDEVFRRLQNAGFNSAICKSKWKNLSDIPSGGHTFVDVVENSNNPKRGEVRIIIELNFRGEFEMARSNEEYGRLVTSLPEVFVGKIERLLSVIKIMCTAAKRCMKERKMHLGPWRKQKYMQAKWLRTCHRTITAAAAPESAAYSGRAPRPTASMLTVDLLDNLAPTLHRTAVAVV